MERTLHDLGRILLNAIPTFLIVTFLVLYLRAVFFNPLAGLLQKRFAETEGAKQAAEESMRAAERRVAEYEEKLRAARGELYAEQDKVFRGIQGEHAARLESARRDADTKLSQAVARMDQESSESKAALDAQSGDLADRIVARVLEGRPA